MVKNDWEIHSRYSKVLPFWVINPENKPTLQAFNDYCIDTTIMKNNNDDIFRYDERTLEKLTIISKDPDIKYLTISMSSSTPIVHKPFFYTDFHYYVERVSFYATGVWKIEFKRDYITLWIQFLQNIRDNNLGSIRTLTTRTNLIGDNYQFEDEKLKELPLKISGWKVEKLTPHNNIISQTVLNNGCTRITAYYGRMSNDWYRELDRYSVKGGTWTFDIDIVNGAGAADLTNFQEYYVFNTEEYGMVYIPRVVCGSDLQSEYISIKIGDVVDNHRIYKPEFIEKYLVNNKWASQFLGVYILPNWLSTSIPFGNLPDINVNYQVNGNDRTYTFSKLARVWFGIGTTQIMSINYQIPQSLKVDITKNKKLGVSDSIVAQSILQAVPSYLNNANSQFNFQKYPDFFDLNNNILRFKFDFIFTGFGVATYRSKYEQIENWIKNLPNQLPSSTSKFAQYIQANQNVLQTGIWVKQEEARLNQLNGLANALVGAGGMGVGTAAFALGSPIMGSLGMLHGLNQSLQGITNTLRAKNEVKFEKARVKAKYADTFNSSTRQINYSQAVDALAKEFTENALADVLIMPIVDNIVVYNDTIVRCGNKTYEYFNLNDLLTISQDNKYNYFEINSENFYKETSNFPTIWNHFTFEEISQILEWLEDGVRLWKTKEVAYEYHK